MHVLIFVLLLCTRAVDEAVLAVMRSQHVAGLSLAMSHNGRVTCERGFGYSNLGSRSAAESKTVYRVGSLTKSFTAAAVLQLVRQGKLRLNDSIATLADVPWLVPISIEDLLLQRSGIPSYTDASNLSRYAVYTPQQLVDAVTGEPLAFEPGAAFAYSNTNYVLLGMAIERVSGEPFGTFLHTQILTPLQLGRTFYGDPPGEARGYARDTLKSPVRRSSVAYAFSAAGMSSDAPDVLKWIQAAPAPYYGFLRGTIYGYAVWFARGNVDGYSAFAVFDERKRDAIAILTNADALDLAPLAMDLFATLEPPKPGTRAPDKL